MPTIRVSKETYKEIQGLIEQELLKKKKSIKTEEELNKLFKDIAAHKVWISKGKIIEKLVDYYKKA